MIPIKPMTDSESLHAIREGLVYMNLEILTMFLYLAVLLPVASRIRKSLDWKEKR